MTSIGPLALLDRLLGDDALLHVAARGELELDVKQGLLEDRAQPAGAGLALERLVGDRAERVGGEDELDVVELEEARRNWRVSALRGSVKIVIRSSRLSWWIAATPAGGR